MEVIKACLFSSQLVGIKFKKFLVMNMAVNMEMMTPRPRVTAKPLTALVVNMIRMKQVIKVLKLLSLIEGQARLNPSSIEVDKGLPLAISSFILAKIKILASTAIPTETIAPANPAKVKVTGDKPPIKYNNI